MNSPRRCFVLFFLCVGVACAAEVPVKVVPVIAAHGMVVAGHPQATEIGLNVLKSGGNAIDAAVATSLALGVAEAYGSGLGGKLMLLYYEAKSGRTFAVDAMDAAGTFDADRYRARPVADRTNGYGAVCVPGLGAGLWAAHQKWGAKKWADTVQPAIALARAGAVVLPKTRDLFAEVETRLRRGDAEIARLFLPRGALPEEGSLLRNEDLARTLELFAAQGRDGFYRGAVAEAIVAAAEKGGGVLTRDDFARYEARLGEPVQMEFRGNRILSAPPPAMGAALFLPALKVMETEALGSGLLRTPANLDLLGRVWGLATPAAWNLIGDAPEARFNFERLVAPDTIRAIRAKISVPAPARKVAAWEENPFYESAHAATTHFIVVDAQGNIVCATQSLSLHFGAGVVAPGTGVVLNNSMSNFVFTDPNHPSALAPGKRPRSTIAPTIVFRAGKPVLALGIPGAARIPTALFQVLLDRLALGRPLAEAIGDTRVHYATTARDDTVTFEAEQSLGAVEAESLRALGWKVELTEAAGRGRYFGGINAVEINADGSRTGYADPRRTNAAAGY